MFLSSTFVGGLLDLQDFLAKIPEISLMNSSKVEVIKYLDAPLRITEPMDWYCFSWPFHIFSEDSFSLSNC
jgi:hypothetical protein